MTLTNNTPPPPGAPPASLPMPPPARSSDAARVLLVDDDLKFCKLLTGYLESQGFVIGVAHDGAAALKLVKEADWDLMVLDVMMPGVDGFEVLGLLRGGVDSTVARGADAAGAEAGAPGASAGPLGRGLETAARGPDASGRRLDVPSRRLQLPVLMLTGRGTENDLVRGLNAGADDYLPKTASARELLARINALLRRSAVNARLADTPAEIIAVPGLRIDPEARTVEVDGRPLSLTTIEYALLVSLVRNKGRVRSREQLLQETSDRRFENFDRSVDVHIASLRRKLGDDSRSARFIRTVRAAGYLFIDAEQEAPAP